MAEIRLRVARMCCRRCVREVTARLRDVAGVDLVTADVDDGTVTLRGDMSRDEVLSALARTTYQLVILDDPHRDPDS